MKKQLVDMTIPADNRVKIKERRKLDKYQDLVRELKKMWNIGTIDIGVTGDLRKD